MRSVVYLSKVTKRKKKNGIAKTVEAEKPNQETSDIVSEEQEQEKPIEAVPVSIENIIAKVDPKQLQMADEIGIPIKDLLLWCRQQEQHVRALQENLPRDLKAAVTDSIREAQKEQQAAFETAIAQQGMQQNPQIPMQANRGVGIGDLLGMVAGAGGTGGDSEMAQLGKELIRAQIDKVKAEESVLLKLGAEVLAKIMSRGVKATVETVTGA